ncbi:MAG: EAL and HDOD domain-containing protein [Desulfovibrio sp.]|uniref:EAL and HDOD domain-containing protein n=1 Tax=Desulfovibrio sp. 7SRBS1 TaxID=3378064 RepID=UPI003B3E7BE9
MTETPLYEDIFIARQPIFDGALKLWGYELLYRDSGTAQSADFSDGLAATMEVIANATLCPDSGFDLAKVMINFPERAILSGMPRALPPASTVIQLSETSEASDILLDCLRKLKFEGYTIAIDDYEARPGRVALVGLADIVIMDISTRPMADVALFIKELRAARPDGLRFLAKKIEDHDRQRVAKRLGFDFFQGFFFQKPKTVAGRKISTNEITRLRLFDIIEQDEPDFESLAKHIESDVSISYRLLTFLNSAAFSFATEIRSIRQAVVLAGWVQIRNWLRLIILTDLAPSDKTMELVYRSTQRARFLESAAALTPYSTRKDELFLMGLFSLLEGLLDTEMSAIVDHLPLPADVTGALQGEDNEFYFWLRLLSEIETAAWDQTRDTAVLLGLDPVKIPSIYQESIGWANSFFNPPPPSEEEEESAEDDSDSDSEDS